jgi:hypothetical protein
MKNRSLSHLYLTLLLLIAIQACTFAQQTPEAEPVSTVGVVEPAVPSATVAMATAPQPAATLAEEQAQPTATQTAASSPTTQVLPATSTSVDLGPTQTALAPIAGELQMYGVDPQAGQIGWMHPPVSVEVDQYRGSKFENQFPTVIAKDFVMESDITWDTEYGGSGCALAFHSDGDQQAPNQYLVIASRLANGHVAFAVMSGGRLVIGEEFYAKGIDPKFNANNGATNRLTVVGQGMTFTIYSNGTKLGVADPTAPLPPLDLPGKPRKPPDFSDEATMEAYRVALQEWNQSVKDIKEAYNQRVALWSKVEKDFPSGSSALGAVAQSGRTQCTFNNAWLWLIGTPGE